ncbi:MAG TPA: lipid-A-disaccharide synthase [Pyrinomonadaceae bacterium]|nr:lipid-A-disaccharide synthase [Pyrinomonadaceae bacterium]
MPERFNLMLVAGEPSGDAHAAALVDALRASSATTQFEFFGATGPQMRAAGVETVVNSDDLAIMGILEVTRVLPKFLSAFNKLKQSAITRQPDAVVLIDWPEFNLRLASSLHRRRLKIIYYISPQLWAWRPRRVRNVVRDVDLLLSILPFESEWYAARGVKHVSFVGHPLSGEVVARLTREEFCHQHDLDSQRTILAFLPGSRSKELQRILPPMIDAIEEIRKLDQGTFQFVIAVAPSRTVEETRSVITRHKSNFSFASVSLIRGQTREVLAVSQAAAVASGTATLEAALLETPMVIVYKESAVNWHTLGRLITAEHYGLVNLVAGERLATELMQDDLTGQRLATELLALLEHETNKKMRERLRDVALRLGEPGASKRAAEEVLTELRSTDYADYTEQSNHQR